MLTDAALGDVEERCSSKKKSLCCLLTDLSPVCSINKAQKRKKKRHLSSTARPHLLTGTQIRQWRPCFTAFAASFPDTDSQSRQKSLRASRGWDGAQINYHRSGQEFQWRYKKTCKDCTTSPALMGHICMQVHKSSLWTPRTLGRCGQSRQLSSSSLLVAFILHQTPANAAFHIYGGFFVDFANMFSTDCLNPMPPLCSRIQPDCRYVDWYPQCIAQGKSFQWCNSDNG